MRYLSVCSGIEAASVAWESLGWTPVAFAEIEKFPSKVLAHHYPGVPNLGDMTKFREWDIERGAVDVLVGGTPCQSFSVAGLRKGLDDPRGNLALTFVAMVDHYRPEWVIWENVPGVLSSSGGRDFGSFLGALGQLGYGFAYRVLDAQYFGVPQRRRRVFVVAHSSGDSRRAAEVLFEPESLRGVHSQGENKGKTSDRFTRSDETASGVWCLDHRCDWEECGCWCIEDAYCPWCEEWTSGLHHTPFDEGLSCCGGWVKRICGTLSDGAHMGGGLNGQDATSGRILVDCNNQVRRLTPTECERLQGFPDGYTDIMPETPDGPRYKALGNSMAVPVMRWIGSRIALATK